MITNLCYYLQRKQFLCKKKKHTSAVCKKKNKTEKERKEHKATIEKSMKAQETALG